MASGNRIRAYFSALRHLMQGNFTYFYRGFRQLDLIIFDSIFPHPVSGFRREEFAELLEAFDNSKIVVSPSSYASLKTPVEKHREHISALPRQVRNKVEIQKGFVNVNTKLFYCVFLSNICSHIDWLEKHQIPFAFTLYPGGGFVIDDAECDAKMQRVFSSPMFRGVMVTQQLTKDYLLRKKFCEESQIQYIFGCVVPQDTLSQNTIDRQYYPEKPTFDICFCAAKYLPKGEDKGYDLFIEAAKKLISNYDFVRFHVIGGFGPKDIDLAGNENKFVFYGYRDFDSLAPLFREMDVLVSPNRPFMLKKGAFDGFPLGTAIEAALNGSVVVATDELNQNAGFTDQQDLVIIEPTGRAITEAITALIENHEKFTRISNAGRQKFSEIYDNKIQMEPRVAWLKSLIQDYD